MDPLAWLRLQLEWGADEALSDQPLDRRGAPPPGNQGEVPAASPQRDQPAPAWPPAAAARAPLAAPAAADAVASAHATAAAAVDPAALRAALAEFEGCPLRTTATTLVFSAGAGQTGLVLVADVPGADEDRAGLPFAGAAAAFLNQMFTSAGLDLAGSLCTSLLPWRPPGGRPPTEAEVQVCLPFLHRHMALLRPRHALLIGGLTARTLLAGVSRRPRGGWQAMVVPGLEAPVQTLALPTLAHIQRTAAAKRDAWADLLRLRRAMIS